MSTNNLGEVKLWNNSKEQEKFENLAGAARCSLRASHGRRRRRGMLLPVVCSAAGSRLQTRMWCDRRPPPKTHLVMLRSSC